MSERQRTESSTQPDGDGLRVVIVGATGNVGSSVVEALAADPQVGSILGLSRRMPDWPVAKTSWAKIDLTDGDVAQADLVRYFEGADVVIQLSWIMQPTHRPMATWRTNVQGTLHALSAVARARVPALVYASSVGAYSPGPKDAPVPESWPTHGWQQASYCREKAYLERVLDTFEFEHPQTRVVRMRPGFIFKQESATEQRRLMLGPLLPSRFVSSDLIQVIPDVPGMRFQVLHSSDVAEAYRLAAIRPVRGAFNLAAGPVVDAAMMARIFDAHRVRVPRPLLRGALAAAWHSHLVPASPQLFDAVMRLPLMDTSRAMDELGWSPRFTAEETLTEFVRALREGTGMETPPLTARLRGGRLAEIVTGVGSRP